MTIPDNNAGPRLINHNKRVVASKLQMTVFRCYLEIVAIFYKLLIQEKNTMQVFDLPQSLYE